ncbi:hypothetical protein P7K49_025331 [Saguinus oedipus]|uniref:Uncharacterized protein n=1 Tax=Saguinus oedipus TaxID=9490 RepID=A0ABQ9UGU8_SAGOE|nr:hypothetical protein P7K49_025331 [Saguinus oedipus]
MNQKQTDKWEEEEGGKNARAKHLPKTHVFKAHIYSKEHSPTQASKSLGELLISINPRENEDRNLRDPRAGAALEPGLSGSPKGLLPQLLGVAPEKAIKLTMVRSHLQQKFLLEAA